MAQTARDSEFARAARDSFGSINRFARDLYSSLTSSNRNQRNLIQETAEEAEHERVTNSEVKGSVSTIDDLIQLNNNLLRQFRELSSNVEGLVSSITGGGGAGTALGALGLGLGATALPFMFGGPEETVEDISGDYDVESPIGSTPSDSSGFETEPRMPRGDYESRIDLEDPGEYTGGRPEWLPEEIWSAISRNNPGEEEGIINALISEAEEIGAHPFAIAAKIYVESRFDPSVTNSAGYTGLSQMGRGTFNDYGGSINGVTYEEYQRMPAAEQIGFYSDWLSSYGSYSYGQEYNREGGGLISLLEDFGFRDLTAPEQFGVLQNLQFGPNVGPDVNEDWLRRYFEEGETDIITSDSTQAAVTTGTGSAGRPNLGATMDYGQRLAGETEAAIDLTTRTVSEIPEPETAGTVETQGAVASETAEPVETQEVVNSETAEPIEVPVPEENASLELEEMGTSTTPTPQGVDETPPVQFASSGMSTTTPQVNWPELPELGWLFNLDYLREESASSYA